MGKAITYWDEQAATVAANKLLAKATAVTGAGWEAEFWRNHNQWCFSLINKSLGIELCKYRNGMHECSQILAPLPKVVRVEARSEELCIKTMLFALEQLKQTDKVVQSE